MCKIYTSIGLPFPFLGIKDMKTFIYKRIIAKFKNSLLENMGTHIPVKLWNKGPL